MARTEQDSKKEKRKAKKRKHEVPPVGSGSDDETVADKSLIVEERPQQESEAEDLPQPKVKASKRKQLADGADIKEKRKKDENNAAEPSDDLPTADQLKEAAMPENLNAVVTVRQKKKQKHLKRLEAQKDQSADKEAKRNEEYLRKWRDSRQDWKFEKLRQISIQQTAFDEKKLNDDVWTIALEYLAGSKGAGKETMIKLAEDAIQKLDKECEELSEEVERQAVVDSTRYQRARQLLQSFD
ncbi:CG15877 [Drosophila busckii]|uniref:CG15877 n=1 Tax=Drosophila busckii TaxID=30019 RepID=A0A0M4EXW4_DROBS|nr:uncharacterized protein C7orf50 homolog [Drosophila busckii]ALC42907.1 CG15877 [Drosophila busckii]